MSRIIAVLVGALLLSPYAASADETAALQEIRELKQLIEQQMKRIDELTVEVGRLHQSLEAQRAASTPGPAPKREVVGPPPFSGLTEMRPAGTKTSVAKAEPPKPEAAPAEEPKSEAPKAEAVSGVKHLVEKGETLTSIAKQYNVPLPDLQKANKNVNDRKLQIGQTLTIPTSKPADAPATEKKENP